MAQILVRNLDETLVEKLKERAQRNNRSLEAEVRTILQQATRERNPNWRENLEEVRKLLKGRTFSDSAELIREDRDR